MSCATTEFPFDEFPHDISYDDLNRREVRSLIFHLLYAAEIFEYDASLDALVDNFNRGFSLSIDPSSQTFKITQEIIDSREQLDELIRPLLHNWRFDRIGVCTKLILRYAVWELKNTQTPGPIIINEAIELAKCFSEKDAYKFVNGILDEAVKKMERAVDRIEAPQEAPLD